MNIYVQFMKIYFKNIVYFTQLLFAISGDM